MIRHQKTGMIASIIALSAALLVGCDKAEEPAIEDTNNTAEEKQKEATSMNDATNSDDPYVWLEEVEGEKALAWVETQNTRTLNELEEDARYQVMFEEAKAILTSDERIAGASFRGGFAYNFWQDETNKRGLWRRMPIADYLEKSENWENILDFDALAEEEGENWVYKGTSCLAPEYNKCMITLSRGGSDASVRREFDIATKSFVEGGFALEESKGAASFADDDTIYVGSDFGEGTMTDSGYPRTVRKWVRGQDVADAETVFEGEKTDVGIWGFMLKDGDNLIPGVSRAVTFFESETYLMQGGEFKKLPLPLKASLQGISGNKLIATLQQDWDYKGATYKTGSIVALDRETWDGSLVFEPTDRVAVQSVVALDDFLLVRVLDNIVGKVYKYTPSADGWNSEQINLPDAGVVSIATVDEKSGDMLVYFQNPTTPSTQFFVKGGELEATALRSTPEFFNAEGIVTRQYEATSSDGTKIPYFVTAKQSVLDEGPAPTIQYGYGGFQVSMTPTYSGTQGKMWLERGGVYVLTNIRGGGEFGPEWHQAALKENRQIAYNDFFAISEDLIAKGITTPKQLGILGGSNGGLLMGVSMTQRPDLYNAIGIGVPLLDMLKYHTLLAGASWVGEYGNPDIPEERAYIEKYSPYQNLKEGVDYPRVYFFTSTKDDRVHPGHARKMAAKMEGFGMPFLYYENTEGGHAASANQDQTAKRLALQYVYFSKQLAD